MGIDNSTGWIDNSIELSIRTVELSIPVVGLPFRLDKTRFQEQGSIARPYVHTVEKVCSYFSCGHLHHLYKQSLGYHLHDKTNMELADEMARPVVCVKVQDLAGSKQHVKQTFIPSEQSGMRMM